MSVRPLPESTNEYWDGSQTHLGSPKPIPFCPTHTKDNYLEHHGWIDNHDGTASCQYCPLGLRLAGYLKVKDGRIIDLRALMGK